MAYGGTKAPAKNGARPKEPEQPKIPDPMDADRVRRIVEDLFHDPDYTRWEREIEQERYLTFCDDERKPKIPNVPIAVTHMSPDIELACHKYKRRAKLAGGGKFAIRVVSQKEGEKAEARGDKCERFFRRHDEEWRRDGVHDGVLFDQSNIGAGMYHLRLDPEAVPTAPDTDDGDGDDPDAYIERVEQFLKDQKRSIFMLEDVDPATCAWKRDWSMVAQQVLVDVAQTEDDYDVHIELDGSGKEQKFRVLPSSTGEHKHQSERPNAKCHLIILETKHYCYHLLTGEIPNYKNAELVGTYRNLFGRPGYVIVGGDITRDRRPFYRYRPLVRGMYQAVPHENVMGTLKLAAGVKAGQHQYALEAIDNESELPEGGLEIRIEDGVLMPPDGYRIVAPKLDVGFDLTAAFDMARNMTREYGFPLVLDKPEEVKASAGYERALMQDTVSSILDEPLANWAQAIRTIFLMMATAVREFPLAVTVRTVRTGTRTPEIPHDVFEEVSLEKDDVIDMDLTVGLDSVTTYTRVALQEEDLKLLESEQITEDELQTHRGVEDIGEWRRLRRRGKLRAQAEQWALDDAVAAVEKLRAAVLGAQVEEQQVDPLLADQAGLTPPPPDGELTPSIPTGPGAAMPIVPPAPEELNAPMGGTPGVMVG